jgi:hypothetical protein
MDGLRSRSVVEVSEVEEKKAAAFATALVAKV